MAALTLDMNSEQASDIYWHHSSITRELREKNNRHKAAVLWFTGFSGSGKSTLANAVEKKLYQLDCQTVVLDGDNIRHGLCEDLGFSDEERKENLRRIGEVSKLFVETGFITLAAFVSPFRQGREKLRALFPECDFIEIYVKCALEVCKTRDRKGLYKRAYSGKVKDFTGISSPYEPPFMPELTLKTDVLSLEESVDKIMEMLFERSIIW